MRRLRDLFHRRTFEDRMSEEIRFHIEHRVEDLIRRGHSPDEARRLAILEFGSREAHKEKCREAGGFLFFSEIWRDLQYASRILRRSPGFTFIAVLSLALGIGANTVVFSVLEALILRPLPITEPRQVYSVNSGGQPQQSFPNYRDLRDRNSAFESLFAYRVAPMNLDVAGSAQRVWGYLVTGNYWTSLGIKPALGRFFTAAEDVNPGASPYAVLSYATWRNRFASDPSIPGKEIRLNGHSYTVLGVAPAPFHGTELFYWPEVWVPMTMQPQIEGRSWLEERNDYNCWVAGRLKPGVLPQQAEANLETIAVQLGREYPLMGKLHFSLTAPGLVGALFRALVSGFAGGIMLLALLVLLAACANLASLLSARASDRFREMAIRVSIGAGRARIIRQLLTESLFISLLGGLAGCIMAVALLRLLSAWHAPLDFPVQFDVSPDWRVFLFAFGAAIATGILFGLGPAWQAWSADPALGLKGANLPGSRRRWAVRDLLLPVQFAICCALVTTSLVAARGLMRSIHTPLGFRPDGAAVIGYDVGLAGYDVPKGATFERRALDAIAQLPGVESAAYSSSVPLSIDQSHTTVYREGTTDFRASNMLPGVSYYYVSPGYFHTAGTRLLAGREFDTHDDRQAPMVAIVNVTLARRVVGTADAVGRRFGYNQKLVEIVGVVEDGKYESLTELPASAVYFSTRQMYSPTIVLMARTSRPESEMATEMRQAMAGLDPHLPIYGAGSLRQMLGLVYLPMNAAAIALGSFGVLAIMLSITGIYGLAAYTVSRRVREIGIRMAIGAHPSQILATLLGRTGVLAGVGGIVGLALGIAGSKFLASIVYQATPQDPVVVGLAVASMTIAGVAAALGPARRALGVDPIQALRQE
jgi:predicted permease